MVGASAVMNLRSDAGTSLFFIHYCVREAHKKCGEIKLCYEAGVLAGAAGVAAGAAAGAAVVLSEDAGVDELVDEVDAVVVLLEVDLLSVL
jgi:hypothetical protein